jgi:hypothetical protein
VAHFSSSFSLFSAVLGARPSKHKIGKSSNTNDSRRRKKAKAKSTVPSDMPGAEVIDLIDNVLAASTALHSATSSTQGLPSVATPQNPSFAPIASPSSCLTQQALSTPAIVPVADNSYTTTQVSRSSPTHALPTSTHTPVHSKSNAPTPPPSGSDLSLSLSNLSPPVPSGELLPVLSQVVAGENSTMTSSVISSPPATDTALGEQEQQVQSCQVNYLS